MRNIKGYTKVLIPLILFVLFLSSCTVTRFEFDVKAKDQINNNIQGIPFQFDLSEELLYLFELKHRISRQTRSIITKSKLEGWITGIDYDDLESFKVRPNFDENPGTGIPEDLVEKIPYGDREKTRSWFYKWEMQSHHYHEITLNREFQENFDNFSEHDENYNVWMWLWTQHKCEVECAEEEVNPSIEVIQAYTDNGVIFRQSQQTNPGWYNNGDSIKVEVSPLSFTDASGKFKSFSHFSADGAWISSQSPYIEHEFNRPMAFEAIYQQKYLKAQVNWIDYVTKDILPMGFRYHIYHCPNGVSPEQAVDNEDNKLSNPDPAWTSEEYDSIPAGKIILKYDEETDYYSDPEYNQFVPGDNYRFRAVHWGKDTVIDDPYYLGDILEDFQDIPLTIKTEYKVITEQYPGDDAPGWPVGQEEITIRDEDGNIVNDSWLIQGEYGYETPHEFYHYNDYGWQFKEWELNDQIPLNNPNPLEDYINFPKRIRAHYNPYLEIRATTDYNDEPVWISGLPVNNDMHEDLYTSNENGNHRKALAYESQICLTPDALIEDDNYSSGFSLLNEKKPLKRYRFNSWTGKYEPQDEDESALILLMDQPQWPIMQLTDQSLIYVTTNHPSGTEVVSVVGSDGYTKENDHRYWSDTNQPYKFKAVHTTISQTATETTHYELEYINVNGSDTHYSYN
ncbi:MAG: hypothetical protein ACOC34_04635 [Thermotogota bacterium]